MKNILLQLNRKALATVRAVGSLAQEKGMAAYVVGGPVRDLLLGRPNLDLDIVVEGNGIKLAEIFAQGQAGAVLTKYPAFKTATVRLADGRLVDFATARQETYARPGAFPAVIPSSIKDDLLRRDFTINAIAIAINPATWGQMVDPFNGVKDIKAGTIRILHAKSFIDDPTRILRAARFKARLGFTIEGKTIKLLKAAVAAQALETIKPQRYLKEFNKIKQEPTCQLALKCLESWHALKKEIVHGAH